MAKEITARNAQRSVEYGFNRVKRFRKARAMFIRQYVGKYYRAHYGIVGDEPLNLIFNAISLFVPNLVMRHGISKVTTNIASYKQYAEILGLALDYTHEKTNFKNTLRKGIVDSFFGLTIFKTGICASTTLLNIEDINIDPGQIYTSHVDLDDFAIDAVCNDIYESSFYANRVRIPRNILLNDKYCNHDLVVKLPAASTKHDDKTEDITQSIRDRLSVYDLNDMVNVIEVYVPDAGAVFLIPDPVELTSDEFIKIQDYYGPDDGSYTFLSVTPPVPGNPFPIAPVGIWNDLHVMANKVSKKVLDQACRQRDIIGYDPANADEAQDLLESQDGDAIAMTDPSKVQTYSFGGQNNKNTEITSQLRMWFNDTAGNPDQLAGLANASSATQSDINQTNSTIRLSDMRDMVYDCASDISKKEAFFIHNDPLIELPLTKRLPGGEDLQVVLTPEQVEGDFINYFFRIKPKSLTRLDPTIRAERIKEFSIKILPGLVTSAQVCMRTGVPFNISVAALQIADEMEILDEITDWFNDPEYAKKIELQMLMGPQPQGKGAVEGQLQNGQPGTVGKTLSSTQQVNSDRQERSGIAQSKLPNKTGV